MPVNMRKNFKIYGRQGQSLIEILIAMAVGVILIGAVTAIIIPTLKTNKTANEAKFAVGLGLDLVERVKVFSGSDWHNLDDILVTSTENLYYLVTSTATSTSPFVIRLGTEAIMNGTTTYTRYFYTEAVCRDATSYSFATTTYTFPTCPVGTVFDPSIRRLTVVYGWQGATTSSLQTFLVRYRSKVFDQADWSGGADETLVATTTNKFSTSSNIDYSNTNGSIKILGI